MGICGNAGYPGDFALEQLRVGFVAAVLGVSMRDTGRHARTDLRDDYWPCNHAAGRDATIGAVQSLLADIHPRLVRQGDHADTPKPVCRQSSVRSASGGS